MPQIDKDPIRCPCGKDAIAKRDNFEVAETEFVHARDSCKFQNAQLRSAESEIFYAGIDYPTVIKNLHETIDAQQVKLGEAMNSVNELELALQLAAQAAHGPWCSQGDVHDCKATTVEWVQQWKQQAKEWRP
ncbi:MAG TPA: hypothetical protein V6C76_11460 [Drouetiella sp.]